jgi:hypothetical protein
MPGLLGETRSTVYPWQLQKSMGLTWGLRTLNRLSRVTATLAENSLKAGQSRIHLTSRPGIYGAPAAKS